MRKIRRHSCMLLFIILSGCAHEQAVREVASLTAARTDDLKKEMAAFINSANEMRTEATQRINSLKEATKTIQIDTAATLQTWKTTADTNSKAAQAIFEAATAFGMSEALPTAAPSLFTDATLTVAQIRFNPAQYEALVKQLTALAAKKSIADEAKFLADYAKAVDQKYKADEAKAAADLTKTNKATKDATDSFLTSK